MNYNIAMHIKFISTLVMVINFMASGVVKTDRTKRVYKGKLERPIEFNQWIKPIALSNVSIDYVQKCSMAGWGGSSVLTEKEFSSVIDEGLQYWIPVNHSDESFPIQGDSGSPMICWYGNSLVAQGLMSSGRRTHPEYKEVWHTSILSHIPWIMDVYDDIKKDFSKDEIRYKVDLSEFSGLVTTSNYSRLTIEYLKDVQATDPVGDPLFICGDTVQECKLLGFHKVQETVQDREKDEFFTIHKRMKKHRRHLLIAVPSMTSGCMLLTIVLIQLTSSQ
uniref:Peptidase S1 domain-containing protein n=1 Tax=Romanomermis culicivorax TaxID=13658 RepID=A0A915IZ84_ROMCU